jgi:hypothetical protein
MVSVPKMCIYSGSRPPLWGWFRRHPLQVLNASSSWRVRAVRRCGFTSRAIRIRVLGLSAAGLWIVAFTYAFSVFYRIITIDFDQQQT